MKRERSLSDFWRHDCSENRGRELVSVLQGADILIGNMGSGIRVTWSGEEASYTDLQRRLVALDYGPLQDEECPFVGSAVDEVIGYAAHEGGHCLWSIPGKEEAIGKQIQLCWNRLPQALQKDWKADEDLMLAELCRIQDILEDAYIDYKVAQRWLVLGEYIRVARNRLHQRTPIDLRAIAEAARPDRNALVNLWVSVSLYNYPLPTSTSAAVHKVLDSLLNLSLKARAEEDAWGRQAMAVEAAIILWQKSIIKGTALPLANQGKERTGYDQQQHGDSAATDASPRGKAPNLDEFDTLTGVKGRGRRVVPVPKSLWDKMAEVMAHKEDLSPAVAQALAEAPSQMAVTEKKADYDPELAGAAVSQLQPQIRELRQTFQRQRTMNTGWLHGLDRGRLDEPRLWKTLVGDSGYYKRKIGAEAPSLAIGLLLDVSGSMSGHMSIVTQTAAIFSQGLRQIPGINFAVWCYTGHSTALTLTRICDARFTKLCLANIEQGGGTPSGIALAGVKVIMEQMPEKQKLLLHFTDGRPDNLAHMLKAAEACRGVGIRVYTIGLWQHSQILSRVCGKEDYETIQTITELPQAVTRILKRLNQIV